ncbi:MAG: MFS transporter [Deferribacteraceae bacterium]|jgi:YNFM family putative membrane transporter|nr:MFS transporter [Deferribacteraceae bacterium]
MSVKSQTLILYLCTILVLCTLYAAQPIQPLFKSEFSLNSFQAAIFTTVIMLPLGIAPILYGYILENFSAKQMLSGSMLFLGILEAIFSLSSSYPLLIGIRAVQGFLIPAALTSLISYISTSATVSTVQKALGNYVAVTIIGGFLGRFLSGVSAGAFGWRPFFLLIGICLIGLSLLLMKVKADAKPAFSKPALSHALKVVKIRHNTFLYCGIFAVFFVFQGLLNFLPFELKTLSGSFSEGKVGFMYAGYIMGVITAFNISKIVKFIGSETKSLIIGALIYLAGLQLFNFPSFKVMFCSMFVFCLGMFMVHTIAAGLVNKLAKEYKSITNGLYLSSYYAGGTFGTFIPGYFFQHYGWHVFLAFLSLALFVGLVFWILLYREIGNS